MKKSEIKVGQTYHNGRIGAWRNERQVTRIISNVVKFKTIKGRRSSLEIHQDQDGDVLLNTFAVWAKGIVKNRG